MIPVIELCGMLILFVMLDVSCHVHELDNLFEGVSSDQSSVEVDGFVVDSSAVLDEKLDVVFVNTA